MRNVVATGGPPVDAPKNVRLASNLQHAGRASLRSTINIWLRPNRIHDSYFCRKHISRLRPPAAMAFSLKLIMLCRANQTDIRRPGSIVAVTLRVMQLHHAERDAYFAVGDGETISVIPRDG